MATRDDLVRAVVKRYGRSGRDEKTRILDEFAAVTGSHRKHAMRVLRAGVSGPRSGSRPERRFYDEAVREALIVLWEVSDRVCGKRLKAIAPILVTAMERHGHLRLAPEIRASLLAMSAATIDRALRPVREQVLLSRVLGELRRLMPFNLLGFDTDNDSVFVYETVRDYCRAESITFTGCRPYRKNDQAFVE